MHRTTLQLPRQFSCRLVPYRPFGASCRYLLPSPFESGPAPPRLPKEEQEIFEQLQRQSTGAFSTPRPQADQSPESITPATSAASADVKMRINQSPDSQQPELQLTGDGKVREGEELHPNIRRGAPPEFEGDVNPKTGEIGGPKNEPLRWGGKGDWSYNGRVTDF
ncbi:DUF1674-domain-containing protein [Lindgomyces ingoldianus]|uniref:DUF1674-domain-containing protein n=1 Tax=Lindgomyces ingoldianus TaxID=673940 RepID=A0ACB6QX86_9PLEO|nr:DUF1674-domain-containing protein [Lindgomyces ingoldianus]KAF2470690.1 DUF1674-domain-containing protein [Lindgomyces ingoldianus]